jgi:hypothetical protein
VRDRGRGPGGPARPAGRDGAGPRRGLRGRPSAPGGGRPGPGRPG